MASRRAAMPTGPSTNAPPLSGPRWKSVSFISFRSRSSTGAPFCETNPHIPHTLLSVVVPAESYPHVS